MTDPDELLSRESDEEWDEEDEGERGPEPDRLQASKSPVEIAEDVFKAGKPEEWDEDA